MTGTSDIPDALITALRDARHVCILTGAGVSAESGVPTFRDAQDPKHFWRIQRCSGAGIDGAVTWSQKPCQTLAIIRSLNWQVWYRE